MERLAARQAEVDKRRSERDDRLRDGLRTLHVGLPATALSPACPKAGSITFPPILPLGHNQVRILIQTCLPSHEGQDPPFTICSESPRTPPRPKSRQPTCCLLERYQSGRHGLPPVDADNRVKAIKEAFWILSEPGRRAAYDASLIHAACRHITPAAGRRHLPLKVEISDVKWTPGTDHADHHRRPDDRRHADPDLLLPVFAFKQAGRVASGEMAAQAQERVMAAERRQMYGNMSEAEIAEQERRERQERADSASRYDQERQERARRDEERRVRKPCVSAPTTPTGCPPTWSAPSRPPACRPSATNAKKEEAERRAEMEEQRRVQERLSRERARWQQELRN
jgi:hypothetical protein